MSEQGADYVVSETPRSSVELSVEVDSKGMPKPKIKVKVYVGATEEEIEEAQRLAERSYQALYRKYVLGEVVP